MKRELGHVRMLVMPLVFGDRTVGCISLTSSTANPSARRRSEILIALAQQATLAIELTRRAYSAKEAAVLGERNRIGQEIHDGLAQAFTGILMQLGAAEEIRGGYACGAPLAVVLTRIRDLAKEGLQEARRSVLALRPDQTRRGGLSLALAQLAERSTVTGRVKCSVRRRSHRNGPAAGTRARAAAHRAGSGEQRRAARASQERAHPADGRSEGLGARRDRRRLRHDATCRSITPSRASGSPTCANARTPSAAICCSRARPGAGTRIRVRLPKRQAEMSTPEHKIRVILADDHPVVRDGLAAIVNQQPDMEVVAEAGDGEQAIALFEQHSPDVMVLDLRMPKCDGVTVVQHVMEKHPKARLLIMTTYDGDEDIFRSLSQGAKGYILKDAPRAGDPLRDSRRGRRPAVHLIDHRGQGAAAHVEAEPHAARDVGAAADCRRPQQQGHRAAPQHHRGHGEDAREVDPGKARCDQPHGSGRGRAQARA